MEQQFMNEHRQSFDELAIGNTKENSYEGMIDVIQSIQNFLSKFKRGVKLHDSNFELVHKYYEKAVNCLKQHDEESSLHYVDLAVNELSRAKQTGYQFEGYDFVIFVLAGFLAINLGLFELGTEYILQLDDGVLKETLIKNLKLLFHSWDVNWHWIIEIDSRNLESWIGAVLRYLYGIIGSPGRVRDEHALENFKLSYARFENEDRYMYLKKGTVSAMMRYLFGCLGEFLKNKLLKRASKGVEIRIKSKTVKHEVENELNRLQTFLEAFFGAENVMDTGCFGFWILVISGVCYQRIEKYDAAALSFQKAHQILGVLENPFKCSLEQIKFVGCEEFCRSKLPSPLGVASFENALEETISGVTKLDLDEVSHRDTNLGNMSVEVETSKREIVEPSNEDSHTENNLENVSLDVENPIYEDVETSKEAKIEEFITMNYRFDWTIKQSTECGLVDFSSFYVERDDGQYCEKGTLLRYYDCSRAIQDLEILRNIEELCPEGGLHVLRVKSPIYSHRIKKYNADVQVFDFVIELGIPLDTWLKERCENFRTESTDQSKIGWWQFIRKDVKRIFRGVIRGMLVFSSLNYADLGFNRGCIFICKSQAKIKPYVESGDFRASRKSRKRNGKARDLHELRKVLYNVIVFPFRSVDATLKKETIGDEYMLDEEMRDFFERLQESKLNVVTFDFLIDSPFFWTREERVSFLFKFSELVRRSLIPYSLIKGINFGWHSRIEKLGGSLGEDAVLHAILYASKSNAYCHEDGDVVRFAVNVLKHYNEIEYQHLRPKALKNVEVELILRRHLPRLYCAIFSAMFHCSMLCHRWNASDKAVCMKELFRSRKDECDSGCSPYVVCDHLLC